MSLSEVNVNFSHLISGELYAAEAATETLLLVSLSAGADTV
jgi:hypothetical protein